MENIVKNLIIPYGFGGLTLPEKGSPIPCKLLMGELMRLGCNFSLLRRSFLADTITKNWQENVTKIRLELNKINTRSQEQIELDHAQFSQLVNKILAKS